MYSQTHVIIGKRYPKHPLLVVNNTPNLYWTPLKEGAFDQTRTTIVVRNAGCACSRCTLKLSLIFLINQSINQSINQLINQSINIAYLEQLIRR